MGPAIRYAGHDVGRTHQVFEARDVSVFHWTRPLGAQIVGHGQIEHGVDDMLAFFFGNLLDRQALVFQFEVTIVYFARNELVEFSEDDIEGLHAARIVVSPHLRTQLGPRHLGFAFFSSAEGGILPRRNAVKQVPVFQSHTYWRPGRYRLAEHSYTTRIRGFNPIQLGFMRFRMAIADDNSVVQ